MGWKDVDQDRLANRRSCSPLLTEGRERSSYSLSLVRQADDPRFSVHVFERQDADATNMLKPALQNVL